MKGLTGEMMYGPPKPSRLLSPNTMHFAIRSCGSSQFEIRNCERQRA